MTQVLSRSPDRPAPHPPPVALYAVALRRAAAGRRDPVALVDLAGRPLRRAEPHHWCGPLRPGDQGLLDRCRGATLDVGCGPGRLTAALHAVGLPSLGVDVSAEAVRQARARGAAVLRRDVFGRLPAEGRWRHALLADGNIGIGGDPERLLARCRALLARGGDLLVEADPPGTGTWRGLVRMVLADRASAPFPWAAVDAGHLAGVAARAGLRVLDTWTEARRWFARLQP